MGSSFFKKQTCRGNYLELIVISIFVNQTTSTVAQKSPTPKVRQTASIETSPQYAQYKAFLKRAHKIHESNPSRNLHRAILKLEQGIINNDQNLEELEDKLTDILLDLDE